MPFRTVFFRFLRKTCPKMGPKTTPPTITRRRFWPPRTLPERLRGAGSILHRFGNLFGTFFLTFDAVFGTCFIDLELAPPPNHGTWLAGFSRVRRLRSAPTINFWPPFWRRFFDFFQKSTNLDFDDPYTVLARSSPSKPLIFRSKFHWFFMFFQNRSRRPFLEANSADRA